MINNKINKKELNVKGGDGNKGFSTLRVLEAFA